jgi:DnaJ-class molecular chaperone
VLQCKECHGSGRRLAGVQTTIRIKPGTPDGTLLNVPTLDGPVRIQLKAVAMRR